MPNMSASMLLGIKSLPFELGSWAVSLYATHTCEIVQELTA